MMDIEQFMEKPSPIPESEVIDMICQLYELGEKYRTAEKIDSFGGYRVREEIDKTIEHLIKADRAFHVVLAQAEQRANLAKQEQKVMLKAQEIGNARKAGEAFCLAAEIAE